MVQADPYRDGRVDFQCFLGNAPPLVRTQKSHGLHVVQTIGKFDEHDTQVAHHRHQHFAEIFCLCLLIGLRFNFFEFGQPVD